MFGIDLTRVDPTTGTSTIPNNFHFELEIQPHSNEIDLSPLFINLKCHIKYFYSFSFPEDNMAQLVTSVIDKYHDILDNKSGKYQSTYGLLLLCNAVVKVDATYFSFISANNRRLPRSPKESERVFIFDEFRTHARCRHRAG